MAIFAETASLNNVQVTNLTDAHYVNGHIEHAYELLHARMQELDYVLRSILLDLPQQRNWLNPDIEKQARVLVGENRL